MSTWGIGTDSGEMPPLCGICLHGDGAEGEQRSHWYQDCIACFRSIGRPRRKVDDVGLDNYKDFLFAITAEGRSAHSEPQGRVENHHSWL